MPNGRSERVYAPRPVSILSVIRSQFVTVRFLGGYTGILEHWKQGRSKACRGPGRCPPAEHANKPIWKGFAPVECWDEHDSLWVPHVLEITESLESVLNGQRLRGLVWSLFFEATPKNHKKVQGLQLPPVDATPLREAFDVRPIVIHCYHDPDILFDVPNPIGPRKAMQPIAGEAPQIPEGVKPQTAEQPTEEELAERKKKLAAMRTLFGKSGTARRNQENGTGKEVNNGRS